jgi:hypothetical protein
LALRSHLACASEGTDDSLLETVFDLLGVDLLLDLNWVDLERHVLENELSGEQVITATLQHEDHRAV